MLRQLSHLGPQVNRIHLDGAVPGRRAAPRWGTQPVAKEAEPEPSVGEPFRKPGPPGQMSGIDDRAREIERNLGLR